MTSLTLQDLRMMLERAGLDISDEELTNILPAAEDYIRRTRELSTTNRRDAEIGGVFRAGSTLTRGEQANE